MSRMQSSALAGGMGEGGSGRDGTGWGGDEEAGTDGKGDVMALSQLCY